LAHKDCQVNCMVSKLTICNLLKKLAGTTRKTKSLARAQDFSVEGLGGFPARFDIGPAKKS
jgi:hypothetical protein